MIRVLALVVLASASACGSPPRAGSPQPPASFPPPAQGQLRAPEAFAAAYPDRVERSRALFLETARVYQHPRCSNCHPDGDSPLQGQPPRLHDPPVLRGAADKGIVGLECTSCHQDRNVELARVPGAPKWHLAPLAMAWVGKTPRQICEQIKDRARNGGKTLAQLVEHSAHDELVAWGWAPGSGREPAPGNQALFGALVQAWVDTGAECPGEEAR